MSDEIETKNAVVENEKSASDYKHSINSLDVLSGAAAAIGTAHAELNKNTADAFGKLEITDKKESKKGDDISNKLEDLLSNKERWGMKEVPLSRTEQLILSNMQDAIKSGSTDKVQDMLNTLAENPASVNRVLKELNDRMSKENGLNSASWEQGTDSNGQNFVRLRLNHQDSYSKSSGGTEVTIGSDGRHSATYRDRWDSQPKPVSPAGQLNLFDNSGRKPDWYPQERYPQEIYKEKESREYKK